jgi:segregation and condensation protein B
MSAADGPPIPSDTVLAAVEAVVFAAGEPVRPEEIARALGVDDEQEIVAALERLHDNYERRQGGLQIEKVAGGFRLATRSSVGPWVRQFFRHRNRARLSPAAIETLAIVAYRQPITSPEIQAIRGVDPSGALRSLLEKRMVRIQGKKKVVGSPFLYGTTRDFLMHFGLDSLEDLPSLEEFEEVLGGLAVGGEADGANGDAQDQRPEAPEDEAPEDGP